MVGTFARIPAHPAGAQTVYPLCNGLPAKHLPRGHRLRLHVKQVTGADAANLGASATLGQATGTWKACRRGGCFAGTVSAAREVSRHQSRRGCMSSADCKSARRPFQLPLAVASQPSSRPPPPRCLFVRSLASCQPPTPSAPCPPPLSPAVSQSPSRPSLRPERHQNTQKKETPFPGPPILQYCCVSKLYSFGPAATRALPASLFSYLWKLLMKRPARSFAFSSHTAGSE